MVDRTSPHPPFPRQSDLLKWIIILNIAYNYLIDERVGQQQDPSYKILALEFETGEQKTVSAIGY